MVKYLKELMNKFKLPKPKELGYKSNSALGLDHFNLNPNEKETWDNYYKDCKKKYPLQYFINRVIPTFASRRKARFTTNIENLLSKYFYKDHLLDLRQNNKYNTRDFYQSGWLAPDSKLIFASFNIFMDYYLHIFYKNRNYFLQYEKDYYDKVMSLYDYWKFERSELDVKISQSMKNTSEYRKYVKFTLNHEDENVLKNLRDLQDKTNQLESEFKQKENEMLNLLFSIRESMI